MCVCVCVCVCVCLCVCVCDMYCVGGGIRKGDGVMKGSDVFVCFLK